MANKSKETNKTDEIVSPLQDLVMQFYVDERVGSIAVRESVDYEISPGLHSDLPDVIAFWGGSQEEDENGDFKQWVIHDWQRNKAENLCAKLNA